jgi:hypothetical protein
LSSLFFVQVDTPYAHGIFVFDVYFPPNYPQVPPLVTFMTTGGGQVRFNPNLYIDGKVCLSLLGLTYAQDESQRWNPDQSSLGQILLSMQSQIFGVEEPYFNEGSGIPEQQRNTPAGREGSRKHNSMLRLATLRHAIVAQLRSPPLGFEEVTQRHFSMCRKRLLVQARRWMLEEKEEKGSTLYRRFEKAYAELVSLLSTQQRFDSLPPLRQDVAFLGHKDPTFPQIESMEAQPAVSQVEQAKSTDPTGITEDNPWANPTMVATSSEAASPNGDGATVEDPDDALYS